MTNRLSAVDSARATAGRAALWITFALVAISGASCGGAPVSTESAGTASVPDGGSASGGSNVGAGLRFGVNIDPITCESAVGDMEAANAGGRSLTSADARDNREAGTTAAMAQRCIAEGHTLQSIALNKVKSVSGAEQQQLCANWRQHTDPIDAARGRTPPAGIAPQQYSDALSKNELALRRAFPYARALADVCEDFRVSRADAR